MKKLFVVLLIVAVTIGSSVAVFTGSPVQVSADDPVVTFPDPGLDDAIREAISKPSGDIYQSDLDGLTYLYAESRGIVDISGIEHCTNLTCLSLLNNHISNISVLSDLVNLTDLLLYYNQINDISALSNLVKLQNLDLAYNLITDISALSGLINLQELQLGANFVMGNFSALSGLSNLSYLGLGSNHISDISSLPALTNLERLDLWDNQITYISALAGLTNLHRLCLQSNKIGDLSALAGLRNLQSLDLRANKISNISRLSGLTNLEFLRLHNNYVSDIQPLGDMINLHGIDLSYNPITDVSPLLSLDNLTYLDFSGNYLTDITWVSGFTKLEYLYLYDNQINSILALSGLINLQRLDFHINQISDIQPLVNNSGLASGDYINLRANPLSASAFDIYIPALQARGVAVDSDDNPTPNPTVSSVSPSNGANDIKADTVITATFSEAMNSSTINASTFTLTDSTVSGIVTYNSETFTAIFTPDTNLDCYHMYTAILSTSITDETGNPLQEPYTWSFTTAPSKPVSSFVISAPYGQDGLVPVIDEEIVFDASGSVPSCSTTRISRYKWNFDDASTPITSFKSQVPHTFSANSLQAGYANISFNVTLTVVDNSGEESDPITIPVTVRRPPVILVHGFQLGLDKTLQVIGFNLDNIWGTMTEYLTGRDVHASEGTEDWEWVYDDTQPSDENFAMKKLVGNGFTVFISNYTHDTSYGTTRDIRLYAQNLSEEIQIIKEHEHVDKVDIIAHSMGGLVSRAYIENEDFLENPFPVTYHDDVRKLIMLGTPNHGALPRFFADGVVISLYEPLQQMTEGSSFLDQLNSNITGKSKGVEYSTIAGGRFVCIDDYQFGIGFDGVVLFRSVCLDEVSDTRRFWVSLKHGELITKDPSLTIVEALLVSSNRGEGIVVPDSFWSTLCSPGEQRVYDSLGRVTGVVNGTIREEIPNSSYDNESETIIIFPANDSYWCKVVGTDNGSYGLILGSNRGGVDFAFTVTDMPTSPNESHQYTVDWDAIANGEQGVTAQIDADGDGTYEETLYAPVAEAGGPYVALVNSPIDFNASGSYDSDGSILLYEWDFDDDGEYEYNSSVPMATHTWAEAYTGNISFRVTDNDNMSVTDIAAVTVEEGIVVFPDSCLDAAVRTAINKSTGDIYQSDLDGLTSLNASFRAITDLIGIEHCTNLIYFNLEANYISDISPLSSLANIEYLDISNNNLSDIDALTGLEELRTLYLDSNQIVGIGALEGLTHIGEGGSVFPLPCRQYNSSCIDIGLSNNKVTDIEPLVNNSVLGSGDHIDLRINPLSATSIDINIPELQGRGVIVDYSPIGDLTGDSHVNVLDMIRIGQHWGQTGAPGWIYEDVKPDGVINVLDMILIGQHWTG